MTFDPMDHTMPPEDTKAVIGLARRTLGAAAPTFVEVGVWAGGTTLALANEFPWAYILAVDHWLGSPKDRIGDVAREYGQRRAYETFCRNMGDHLYSSVFPLIGTSELHASTWPINRTIDFVFIDADHSYEATLRDIQLWTPHVRSGGIIAGHDFGNVDFPGVEKAVKETGPFETAGRFVWWRRVE